MTTAAEIKAEIDQLNGYLKGVHKMMEDGDVVDLVGLDENVARLCTAVAGLEEEEGRTVSDDLKALVAQMDDLRGQMVTERGALAEAMGGLSTRRKAVTAYGKANSRRV